VKTGHLEEGFLPDTISWRRRSFLVPRLCLGTGHPSDSAWLLSQQRGGAERLCRPEVPRDDTAEAMGKLLEKQVLT